MILADGGEAYAALGTGRSRGTQVFQLAGNVKQGGIVEADFGITLRELIEGYGGGTRSGRPLKAAQVGGPLGAYVAGDQLDLPMDYEAFAEAGAMIGHGGIVVFDDTMTRRHGASRWSSRPGVLRQCTPCRIGSVRGVGSSTGSVAPDADSRHQAFVLLEDLCTTMEKGSLCAMGGLTPMPVRSALRHFPADFDKNPPVDSDKNPPVDSDKNPPIVHFSSEGSTS